MRGVNKVIVVGTVGKDPEVKYMQNGNAVCNLSLATNESWTDKQTGEKKERTEWHRVSLFGRLAEIAGEYVRKGGQVYIEGKLRTRSYEKEGQTHYSTDIIADNMQMLGGRQGGGSNSGPAPRTNSSQERGPSRQESPQDDFVDDDIPF